MKKEDLILHLSHEIFLNFCASSAVETMQVSHVRDLAIDAAEVSFAFMDKISVDTL